MFIQFILNNQFVTFSSLLIGLLVAIAFKVVKFYSTVRSLPPGPFPLPLIGNLHCFSKEDKNRLPYKVLIGFNKKYGPIFTFWTGPVVQVIITDPKLVKEALTKVEFAGRPNFGAWTDALLEKGTSDIVFSDFNREWEVLRKVAHTAVRKFAVNERLNFIVDARVKDFLREIKAQNGKGSFNPLEYISFLMLSLLATSAFGRDLTMSDPDFKRLNDSFELQDKGGRKMLALSYLPILKFVYRQEYKDLFATHKLQREYTAKQFIEHQQTYTEGVIRDFTDAMISAKREAEAEDSNDAKYLKDQNIVNTVLDLFHAGSETTKMTLLWVFLYLAEHQDYQKAIREEVQAALGSDEMPTLGHRTQCNLLQAFTLEVMRVRPIVPLGVPHKTIVDTELGGHKIKKGVTIMLSIEDCLMDKETWGDPEVFRPERFLDENNKFIAKPNQYFIPFGGGRRVCLGEKLASANSFLILAGLLHQTKGHSISLPGGPGSVDLSPSLGHEMNVRPGAYQLVFTPVTE